MVVADSRAEHFVLPVGVTTIVIAVVQVVLPHIAADIVGCGDIEFLGNHVECHVAVVTDVGALGLAATLGGDDDHTVGSLRTVDGGSGCVAEHVDALDVIGSHHRDVHTGDTVDDVVR